MRPIHALAVSATLIFALPAAAQTQSAPALRPAQAAVTRVDGELVSISATTIAIRTADGKTATLALSPNCLFFAGRALSPSAIKPGDFVATTNVNIDDHSGRATELRVYPASAVGQGRASSYPMAAPNTTMTNAPVSQVTDNAGGRVLKVTYPTDPRDPKSPPLERQIMLPANLKVISQTALDKSALKPGWNVQAVARPDKDGVLTVSNVQTGENGAPPPTH